MGLRLGGGLWNRFRVNPSARLGGIDDVAVATRFKDLEEGLNESSKIYQGLCAGVGVCNRYAGKFLDFDFGWGDLCGGAGAGVTPQGVGFQRPSAFGGVWGEAPRIMWVEIFQMVTNTNIICAKKVELLSPRPGLFPSSAKKPR